MLCEECHQNEAVYTISVMMGEAMTQRHLCADCMAKMNMNIASYQAFAAQLHPMLLQIHGRVQHAGRKPLQSETDQRSRYEQEELTRQLQLAVNAEDYEHAAEIRDRLRALLGKEEA